MTLSKLYEEDFADWADQNAELLREGRFGELDIEHLVEEVGDMARSFRQEVDNRTAGLLAHLLKWQFQPDRRTNSRHSTIVYQRLGIALLLDKTPSLRAYFLERLAPNYDYALTAAAKETGLPRSAFPGDCPYAPDRILDHDFLPEARQ